MKRFLFLSLSLWIIFQYQVFPQYFPIDTCKLNNAYRELILNPQSKKKQIAFFELYPTTWMEFQMMYQFVPGDRMAYEYDNIIYSYWGIKHMEAFRSLLGVIPDSLFYDKLITLSIGGKWGADNTSFLQRFIQEATLKNPKAMVARLSKHRKGYQLRFWQFYWSSLEATHEYEQEHARLRKILIEISPAATKIMDVGFEYAWKEMEFPDFDFVHLKSYKQQ